MRTKILLAVSAAAMALSATSANAAANLTSATVTGLNASGAASGTVWTTNANNSFYTLFIQQPFGSVINSGKTINDPTTGGLNSFTIAGEGYYPGQVGDSDPAYRLTLGFADGATISGVYNKDFSTALNTTSSTVGGTQYTFGGFSWNRILADNVSANSPVSGGDRSDYAGQFSFSTSAVPEPGTWAMMLAGFGMIGLGMRSRRSGFGSAAVA